MSAISAATFLGVSREQIAAAVSIFENAPHRMEFAGQIEGITFINDSKATNVDSVYYALDTFDSGITWIAGGKDKGNDYSKISSMVEEKVQALICLGADNTKLKSIFSSMLPIVVETQNVKEAARIGYEYSQKNDVVLFSPACASFDLFKNYEDRGNQFKQAVQELKMEVESKISDQL